MRISKKVQFIDRSIYWPLVALEIVTTKAKVNQAKPSCEGLRAQTNQDMNTLPSTQELLLQFSTAPQESDCEMKSAHAKRNTTELAAWGSEFLRFRKLA